MQCMSDWSACASTAARASAISSESFMKEFDFPYVTNLRDTQVYVHGARDGLSVFDMPRSRVEQDWEQWRTLTRWIGRQTAK
jgi:chromosome partitioning protein